MSDFTEAELDLLERVLETEYDTQRSVEQNPHGATAVIEEAYRAIVHLREQLKPKPDCMFYYFKPGGKWKYEGEGFFPNYSGEGWHEVDRYTIKAANGGEMPGISGDAHDLVVVIIPMPHCNVTTAYPRMLGNIK